MWQAGSKMVFISCPTAVTAPGPVFLAGFWGTLCREASHLEAGPVLQLGSPMLPGSQKKSSSPQKGTIHMLIQPYGLLVKAFTGVPKHA